jgi:RimJ/RimL family protein N-acetyltransferase
MRRREWPELWIGLGEATAGIVFGLIAAVLSPSPVYGVIVGLLVITATACVVGLHRHAAKLRALDGQVQGRIDAIEGQMRSLVSQIASSEETHAQRLMLLKFGQRQLYEPAELPDLWGELLWSFRQTYIATNHIRSFGDGDDSEKAGFYHEGFARTAHELQAFRIRFHHVTVRKVHIVDDPAELADISGTIAEQQAAGMDIKYIFWRHLRERAQLWEVLEKGRIESEDFGVFDKDTVLVWRLDARTRRVTGGRVLVGEAEARPYLSFYDQLAAAAHRLPTITLTRLSDDDRRAILHWERYTGDFKSYNYALGEKGWHDRDVMGDNTLYYAARHDEQFVGFSLLVPKPATAGRSEAEFYVAVRPSQVGRGFGPAITLATLRRGFEQYDRIHLKVRPWNDPARRIYESLGFERTGPNMTEMIEGEATAFVPMHLDRDGGWRGTRAAGTAGGGGGRMVPAGGRG